MKKGSMYAVFFHTDVKVSKEDTVCPKHIYILPKICKIGY